ncbi:hypothetical protein [Hydrogenophaga sp.]|uniref:hypothetical protein n=1 Tax=Hydrogenophaga sp. TaxID=1904254 RepID=UPI003F6AB138
MAHRLSATVQQQRDRDAVAILQAELARNLSAQRAQADAGGRVAVGTELHRLRQDEVALRRELERHER